EGRAEICERKEGNHAHDATTLVEGGRPPSGGGGPGGGPGRARLARHPAAVRRVGGGKTCGARPPRGGPGRPPPPCRAGRRPGRARPPGRVGGAAGGAEPGAAGDGWGAAWGHRRGDGPSKCQANMWGFREEFKSPPLGASLYANCRTMVANGQAAATVLYHYD